MSISAFRIRTATPADISDILGLWVELMDYHGKLDPYFTRSENSPEEFVTSLQQNMADGRHLVVVAVEDKKAVGFCQAGLMDYPPVFANKGCGFIYDLAVTESYRRRGIGLMLFEAVREWVVRQGRHHIELNLHVLNPVSRPFWDKLGFKSVLERRRLTL